MCVGGGGEEEGGMGGRVGGWVGRSVGRWVSGPTAQVYSRDVSAINGTK